MSLDLVDYFDVLPYHPQPKPFESLTGYLTRLAQGNGIKSVKAISAVAFPDRPSEWSTPPCSDYLPRAWGALPVVTTWSVPDLLATTFYCLMQKFGRSVHNRAMARFLNNSMSDGFRYCPLCLHETAYHHLTWRFLTLKGCVKHGCRFLDRCGHCGGQIPLLATPLAVGICPYCQEDLTLCRPDPLPEQDWPTTHDHLQDLQFLLSPEPSAGESNEIKSIGLQFAYWRLEQGLLPIDIARQATGLSRRAVYAMEGRDRGGANFFNYVQYAACLGVTLQRVCNTVLPAEINDDNWREWCQGAFWREQKLTTEVQMAITQLEAARKPVTQQAIYQLLGRTGSGLSKYPQVRAILEEVNANRKAQQQQGEHWEKKFLPRVQAVIDRLKAEGKPINERNICRLAGLKFSILKQPSRVEALIKQTAAEPYLIRQQQLQQRKKLLQAEPIDPEEREVMRIVYQAIDQLKQAGQRISIRAICRSIHRSDKKLRTYPHVALILEQVTLDGYFEYQRYPSEQKVNSQREEELVQAVQAAVAQLEAEEKLVTQKAIAQIIGLSHSALKEYPRVKTIFDSLPQKRALFLQEQRQRREQQLVAQVQAAIQKLEMLNQPLKQQNIAHQVGASICKLRNYPRVREILDQLIADRRQVTIAQTQQRDRELAEKTQYAAQTLIQLGQPITKLAISRLAGVTPATYKSYPQAARVLNQVVQR